MQNTSVFGQFDVGVHGCAPAGLRHVVDCALGALWPRQCLVCDGPGQPGLDLCAQCDATLPWLPQGACCPRCALPSMLGLPCARCSTRLSPLRRTLAAFHYTAPVDRLLPRIKFHDDFCASALMSQLMLRVVQHAERPDCIIPIPLHTKRLRARGYNQAAELAKPLARALDVPLATGLLTRTRHTTAQSTLDREARAVNMQDVFGVRARVAVPKHVALVDDVFTTGATLEAAAYALRAAGVVRVDAWVCARVE